MFSLEIQIKMYEKHELILFQGHLTYSPHKFYGSNYRGYLTGKGQKQYVLLRFICTLKINVAVVYVSGRNQVALRQIFIRSRTSHLHIACIVRIDIHAKS